MVGDAATNDATADDDDSGAVGQTGFHEAHSARYESMSEAGPIYPSTPFAGVPMQRVCLIRSANGH
jgi:hypothetical protein